MSENAADAETSKGKGFYEAKGMSRYTLILGKEHKDKLAKIADDFSVSQGNVIEVMLDQFDADKLGPHLEAKQTRTGGRKKSQGATQRDIINELKGMTPEQLEIAQKAILAAKAPKPDQA